MFMDDKPLVSVIMPVFNGERFIVQALRSALMQDYQPMEIIVMDDGSTDRSARIAQEFAAAHPDRVRYYRQDNTGLSAARNAAIARSRGRYLALLDCDDVWHQDHLARAVAALEQDPGTVLVHGNVRFIDATGESVGRFLGHRHWDRWAHDPFRAILLRHEHVACPTAVFRKQTVEETGGFDLRYDGFGCEDRDMWLRLALMGRVRYLDYHAADYRVHSGGMSRKRERMLQARRMLVERMREFPPGRRLYSSALAAVALSEAEECSGETERGRIVRAYLRAIRCAPHDIRGWRGLVRACAPGWLRTIREHDA